MVFLSSKLPSAAAMHSSTVVVEFGTHFVRAGMAGETTPRHIIATPEAVSKGLSSMPLLYNDIGTIGYTDSSGVDELVGSESTMRDTAIPAEEQSSFDQHDFTEWTEILNPMLNTIMFDKLLLIKLKNRRVIIVEPSISPTAFRNSLAYVILGRLRCHSLRFTSSVMGGSSALITTGKTYGLVVDVGKAETRCAAIYSDIYVPGTFQAVPCGYEDMVRTFQSHTKVSKLQRMKNSSDEMNKERKSDRFNDASTVFRSATEILGGIPAPSQGESLPSESQEEHRNIMCTLPSTGENVTVDSSSIVFAWNDIFNAEDCNSLVYAVLLSLKACPMDIRKAISSNILCVGGGAMISNITTRLQEELCRAVNHRRPFKCLKGCANSGTMHTTTPMPFSAGLAAWIGASIVGTLDDNEEEVEEGDHDEERRSSSKGMSGSLDNRKWISRQRYERLTSNSEEFEQNQVRHRNSVVYDWLNAGSQRC